MGHFALYVLWAQSLWAPAVTPIPPSAIRLKTESITVHLIHFIPLHYIYIILYLIRIQLCILLYIIYIFVYFTLFKLDLFSSPLYNILFLYFILLLELYLITLILLYFLSY